MALKRLLAPATAGVLLLLVAGCAYYNGLYNARQLAGEARRAEREGRTGEARSLWSRAAVKAESVAARFPDSKWRDDALLLQGRALAQIDACTRAVEPLALAADSSPDSVLRHEAALTLGRCRLFMREPAAAVTAVGPVVAEGDSARRDEARLVRARALLALDRPDEALADLRHVVAADAAFPRAIALGRLGRGSDAAAALAPRVDGRYDEEAWLAVLDTVGRADPAAASALARRLAERQDLTTGARARLLVADGERWMAAGDTTTAAERFRRAAVVAPDSTEARVARSWLGVQGVRAAQDLAAVDSLLTLLQDAMQAGGRPTQIAGPYVNVLQRTAAVLSDTTPDALALFVAAEELRDSLRAVPLAARLFIEIARRYPESVIAPKALLAAAGVRPADADSLVAVVRGRYGDSVYAGALRGEADERYRIVEDSLRQVLAAQRNRHP